MVMNIRSMMRGHGRTACMRATQSTPRIRAADDTAGEEITHPRATLVAEHRRQGDAERETARTRPLVDVLTPERERLSANHRRHRPATRMLLHLEQALDLGFSF